MNDFIKQQQELARKIDEYYRENFDESTARKSLYITELLTEYQIDIITNTGEKLMRLAEGERKEYPQVESYGHVKERVLGNNTSIDTLKKHITSVTGVDKNDV